MVMVYTTWKVMCGNGAMICIVLIIIKAVPLIIPKDQEIVMTLMSQVQKSMCSAADHFYAVMNIASGTGQAAGVKEKQAAPAIILVFVV